MNSTVLALNRWAGPALAVAWPMLWQSSLLIGFLFALDFAFRRRVRASVRYALWLVVLLKLVLPPSLALPTGVGWWLRPAAAAPVRPHWAPVVVSYGPAPAELPLAPISPARAARPPARLSAGAWGLAGSGAVSLVLLGWMLRRWRQVAGEARGAVPAPDRLEELLVRARGLSGLRRRARVRLIARPMSPAVCGLFRPVILLPRVLAEQLPPHQLRAVLLHELVHLRRGDLWLSFAQALLQIVYWWHPLLWAANARIRRAREEAVDDAVMLALEDQAEAYAPTLIEVARLALARPPVSLGLVGILESGSFLRQRIERLLDFHPPRKAGLTLASVFSVAAFAALAVPMGQAPAPAPKPEPAAAEAALTPLATSSAPATVSDNALAVPNSTARTNLMFTGRGRQIIVRKLDRIRLGEVKAMDNLPLSEVVKYLEDLAKKGDPEGRGINFIIAPGADPAASLPIGVTMGVGHDFRLRDLLDVIVKVADKPLEYAIEDYGVVFSLKGQQPTPLYFRTIELDPGALEKGEREVLGPPEGDGRAESAGARLRRFLASFGADFSPPKSLFFNSRDGTLLIHASLADLDIIEGAVQVLSLAHPQLPASEAPESRSAVLAQEGRLLYEMGKLNEDEAKLNEAEAKLKEAGRLDPRNEAVDHYLRLIREARSNGASKTGHNIASARATLKGIARQNVAGKLNRIHLDVVGPWWHLPLREVIEIMEAKSLREDREKIGIHFTVVPGAQVEPGGGSPTGGQTDIGAVSVTLSQPLKDLALTDVLEVIVKVADRPIKYSIEDYGVVFSLQGKEPTPLYFRTIKVDPAAFEEGLREFLGLPAGGNRAENLGTMLRQFFAECGVDLSPPKSIFYGDREGTLLIYASLADLDMIERAIQVLSTAPPQLPASAEHRSRSAGLVQDGKLLYEMGKLVEAEAKLKEARKADPENDAAWYYLNLVSEARSHIAENQRDALPAPSPYAGTNRIFTGRGRQIIVSKLDKIRIDHFPPNQQPLINIPLGEVVKMLDDLARRRDPTGQGINFIVAPFAGPTGTDPATGLPIAAQGAETVDVNTIGVTISLVLHDLRLADLLEIIVKVAEKPIKYSIEDYAVVFSLKGRETTPLYSRTIKVDPNAFIQGLQGVFGLDWGSLLASPSSSSTDNGGGLATVPHVNIAPSGGGGSGGSNLLANPSTGQGLGVVTRVNSLSGVQAQVRSFFRSLGVDLTPPKTLFFNDREGTMFIYASLADLDIIERAVQVLNAAPAQPPAPEKPAPSRSAVLLQDGKLLYEMGKLDEAEAKLKEARRLDPRNQAVDYYLNLIREARSKGAFKKRDDGGAIQTTNRPSPKLVDDAGSSSVSIEAAFIELPRAEVEGFWEKFGSTNGPAPGGSARTATLTHAQAAAQLDRWKSMGGKNILGELRVTTLSGRQALVSLGEWETMMINFDPGQAKRESILPALEITPRVTGDGTGVKMDLNANLREFLGYVKPRPVGLTQTVSVIIGQVGQSEEERKQAQERLQNFFGNFLMVNGTNTAPGVPDLPLPHLRVQQVTTTAEPVTAVLPLPHFRIRQVTASVNVSDGQTVVLGGQLFGKEFGETGRTDLLILVTPTLVDPAGSPIHPQNK